MPRRWRSHRTNQDRRWNGTSLRSRGCGPRAASRSAGATPLGAESARSKPSGCFGGGRARRPIVDDVATVGRREVRRHALLEHRRGDGSLVSVEVPELDESAARQPRQRDRRQSCRRRRARQHQARNKPGPRRQAAEAVAILASMAASGRSSYFSTVNITAEAERIRSLRSGSRRGVPPRQVGRIGGGRNQATTGAVVFRVHP